MTTTFIDKLSAARKQRGSWLCVGLDPCPDQMPPGVDALTFSQRIVDATADLACAYKPNLIFYLAFGADGLQALRDTIDYIPDDIPVVLDAKFGDSSYAAEHYARVAFDVLDVDAVTISPYVGMDAVTPVLEAYPGKMAFVLVRSSNRTGNDFQLWPTKSSPLFRYVTAQLNTLADKFPDQVGIGAAATHPHDLARLRCWAPSLPFLIPGLGAQGGDLDQAIEQGITRDGCAPLLSVTRSIIYAGQDADFAEAARAAAQQWTERIGQVRSKYAGKFPCC
ncbi:MAG: orotidine-5'-phosphate decarboxylase [Anaerolineae bacterium]|jgi:orotidine-5'-phosphate decarboxylase|nr:orotidine-5'-phosphate decarboxylase [Anaerolineae bacterium]